MNHNDMIARFRQCAMRDHPLRKAVLETLMAYAGLKHLSDIRDNAIREERWQTKTEIRELKRKLEKAEEEAQKLQEAAHEKNRVTRGQRRVVCAAIRLATGELVIGPRHWDGVMHAQADTQKRVDAAGEHGKEDQGFIDQHGVFMSRSEAFEVATEANQILEKTGGANSTYLFSEDIY